MTFNIRAGWRMNRGELGAMGGEPGGGGQREPWGPEPAWRQSREGGAAGLFGRHTKLARWQESRLDLQLLSPGLTPAPWDSQVLSPSGILPAPTCHRSRGHTLSWSTPVTGGQTHRRHTSFVLLFSLPNCLRPYLISLDKLMALHILFLQKSKYCRAASLGVLSFTALLKVHA